MLLPLLCSLVIAHLASARLGNETCIRNDTKVECVIRKNTLWEMPTEFLNMTVEVFGGSSGASLGADNKPDQRTRGIGLHLKMGILDTVPPGSVFSMVAPMNGQDATPTASGKEGHHEIGDTPGNGGRCLGSTYSRYAGSGGTGMCFASVDHRTLFGIGGPGAGGAFDPRQDIIPRGGHSPFLDETGAGGMGIAMGLGGFPHIISGEGGQADRVGRGGRAWGHIHASRKGHEGQENYFAGGDGGEVVSAPYCLAGGGGGSGWKGGGGGGSFAATELAARGFAGSGGSGSSPFIQTKKTFRLISQERMYSQDPRIVIRYELPFTRVPLVKECCGAGCSIM